MPAPFSPRADAALRFALLALIGLAIAATALLWLGVRSPLAAPRGDPLEQPIEFDHRHHVRDDGIDCLYCHHDAERGPTAGVPETELCLGCHAQVWRDSALLAPLRESLLHDRPLAYRRVYDLPDFVFFDHAAHVRHNVGCETCHGRVDEMARVYAVVAPTMDWCLDCHRDPAPNLRPAALITRMGYASTRAEGERIRRERGVLPPTHCSGCHR